MAPTRNFRIWPRPDSLRIRPVMLSNATQIGNFFPPKFHRRAVNTLPDAFKGRKPWAEVLVELVDDNEPTWRSEPSPDGLIDQVRIVNRYNRWREDLIPADYGPEIFWEYVDGDKGQLLSRVKLPQVYEAPRQGFAFDYRQLEYFTPEEVPKTDISIVLKITQSAENYSFDPTPWP